MTHDDLPVSAAPMESRLAAGDRDAGNSPRVPFPSASPRRRVPHSVSPHPRHAAPVKSPRKARRDHNSVYLRPTVVVSEGFRNLSVALGNFRAAARRSGGGGRRRYRSCQIGVRSATDFAPRDDRSSSAIRRGEEGNDGVLFSSKYLAPGSRRRSSASINPALELSVDLASR